MTSAPRLSLERGRATGILAGLTVFVTGFAVAAGCVLAGAGGTPPYLVGISIGLVGIGVGGFFLHRGTVPLPEAPIWSPSGLRAVVEPLDLPVTAVIAALYAVGAFGVLGNLVIPVLTRH